MRRLILSLLFFLALCSLGRAAEMTFTADNSIGVYGTSGTYATARSTSSGTSANMTIGQATGYYVYRGFVRFNTSALPDSAIISQVNLKLTCTNDNSITDFDVQIVKQDWSAQDPIGAGTMEAAYDGCLGGTADASIWRNTSGMSLNTTYTSGNLAAGWVNRTGYTYYSLRSSRDAGNNTPTDNEWALMAAYNHATASYRPQLVVTYTVPTIKINGVTAPAKVNGVSNPTKVNGVGG